MTERAAYLAFLAVAFVGLTGMTATLAVIWWALVRQNRSRDRRRGGGADPGRPSQTDAGGSGR